MMLVATRSGTKRPNNSKARCGAFTSTIPTQQTRSREKEEGMCRCGKQDLRLSKTPEHVLHAASCEV